MTYPGKRTKCAGEMVLDMANDPLVNADFHKPQPNVYAEGRDSAQEGQADQWISVKERMPEYGKWVLVVIGGVVQRQACHLDPNSDYAHHEGNPKVWNWADSEADEAPLNVVTHWQPLPEPPVEEDSPK